MLGHASMSFLPATSMPLYEPLPTRLTALVTCECHKLKNATSTLFSNVVANLCCPRFLQQCLPHPLIRTPDWSGRHHTARLLFLRSETSLPRTQWKPFPTFQPILSREVGLRLVHLLRASLRHLLFQSMKVPPSPYINRQHQHQWPHLIFIRQYTHY